MQKRINLTKTVRKLPINDQLERAGHYLYDDRQLEIKYDDPGVRAACVCQPGCSQVCCSSLLLPAGAQREQYRLLGGADERQLSEHAGRLPHR